MELLGYHVVLTMHNSRTSGRMIKYKISKGPARILTLKEELILTEIIGRIILDNCYRCVAYNICRDHVHMILVCERVALSKIIQKLKSISSKLFHRHPEVSTDLTSFHNNRLWSQKFFRASLDEWTLAKLSNFPGEIYQSSYLANAMVYIQNNRHKHQLEISEELNNIIRGFIISVDEAYGLN